MTTERQRTANRRNAARSTGPKTEAGKRSASSNSRSHGLTTAVEQGDLMRWYRTITGVPEAVVPLLAEGVDEQATLALAEAEAHLERCLAAERAALDRVLETAWPPEPVTVEDVLSGTMHRKQQADYTRVAIALDPPGHVPGQARRFRFTTYIRTWNIAKRRRKLEAIRCHRQRAEGRRRRAFRRWVASQDENAKTKPFATLG